MFGHQTSRLYVQGWWTENQKIWVRKPVLIRVRKLIVLFFLVLVIGFPLVFPVKFIF